VKRGCDLESTSKDRSVPQLLQEFRRLLIQTENRATIPFRSTANFDNS
jgi:hypothetical protein